MSYLEMSPLELVASNYESKLAMFRLKESALNLVQFGSGLEPGSAASHQVQAQLKMLELRHQLLDKQTLMIENAYSLKLAGIALQKAGILDAKPQPLPFNTLPTSIELPAPEANATVV